MRRGGLLILKKVSPLFRDEIGIIEILFMEGFDEPSISAEEVEFLFLFSCQITFLHLGLRI
jgi:hypothetical protein